MEVLFLKIRCWDWNMRCKRYGLISTHTHTHTQHTYTPVTAGVKWSISSCNYQVSSPSAPCRQWHASEGKIARACLRVTECHVVKWLVRKWVCQRFRVALRLTVQACACVCVCVSVSVWPFLKRKAASSGGCIPHKDDLIFLY